MARPGGGRRGRGPPRSRRGRAAGRKRGRASDRRGASGRRARTSGSDPHRGRKRHPRGEDVGPQVVLRLLARDPLRTQSEIGRALGLDRREAQRLRSLLDDLVDAGRVERVGRRYRLAGGRDDWVGIFGRRGSRSAVTPYRDDAWWQVAIPRGEEGGARPGDVVVAVPRGPRRKDGAPRGRVVEVLGPPGEPEADFRAVVWRRRLPVEFPDDVLASVEEIPDALDPAELARRVDLRDRTFVTIDPATARDHDDAVCVEPEGEGFRLWVAIADVSHYVAPGSAIDCEALRRGNSVYFPDRAIPMLPERLSGDLCSLRPDVDRLAMTVELLCDGTGRVVRRHFYPAVIRSRARLVYDDAARAMEGEGRASTGAGVDGQLRALARVATRLRRRRLDAGSIDFDLPSAEIVLGDDRHPVDIVEAPRSAAHRAIEDAMLAANRAVAFALERADVPAIYRNHEPPAAHDLEELCDLLHGFGLLPRALAEGEIEPRDLARALAGAEGRPEERLVQTAVLRSMRLARYGARNAGHFALAFTHYTHFTSPIRRYADLFTHRALKALLGDAPPPGDAAAAGRVATRLSWLERLAMDAEREMIDLKKCAFMAGHVGGEFAGTITGVARHGLYVTLDDFFVEGLVHVSNLPDYLDFDERHHALVARRSGERFHLGDRLAVRVDDVDRIKARIDFGLVGRDPDRVRKGRRATPARRPR